MSKVPAPTASRKVLGPQAYSLEAEPFALNNEAFERALTRRAALAESRRKRDAEQRARTLRIIMERVRQRAEEMRLARERREEEARALVEGGPSTVPAELVKEEADAILREADEKLKLASSREAEAASLVLEAKKLADAWLDDARAKAEEEGQRLWAQSRHEGSQEGREEGSKKGFEDGMAAGTLEGLRQGRGRFEEAASRLESILDAFPAQADKALADIQADVAAAASEIAKRVIAGELSQNGDIVTRIVAEALKEVRDATKVTIRVNPADIMACRAHREEFVAVLGAGSFLRVQEDEGVERGGCLVETNSGRLDSTIPSRVGAALRAAQGPDVGGAS